MSDTLTARELARKAGKANAAKHDHEHFERIGRQGGLAHRRKNAR